MQIVPSLLFGISASLDALLIGITFGIRGARIKLWQNLFISTITLLGTCLSVGVGKQLTRLLPADIWILAGSLILLLFGLYYITKFMTEAMRKCHLKKQLTATQISSGKTNASSEMTVTEVCILALALSANNIGIGLSASIAGLSLLPAAAVTLFFSFIFLFLGNYLGKRRTLPLTEDSANLLSGLLLIILGFFELFS